MKVTLKITLLESPAEADMTVAKNCTWSKDHNCKTSELVMCWMLGTHSDRTIWDIFQEGGKIVGYCVSECIFWGVYVYSGCLFRLELIYPIASPTDFSRATYIISKAWFLVFFPFLQDHQKQTNKQHTNQHHYQQKCRTEGKIA